MIIDSLGREFVWVVFDCDGFECANFVGVFDSEEKANKVADEIRSSHAQWYKEHSTRRGEWGGFVEVKTVYVNLYKYKSEHVLP